MDVKVCFLGGARYDRPLDATSEKKFRVLSTLGEIFVIGFSRNLRSCRFTEHAHFYLLPQLPLPVLRYCELYFAGLALVFWLIVRRRVQVVVAQSPYEGFIAAGAIKVAECLGCNARLVVEVHGDFEGHLFLQRRIKCPRLYRVVMNFVARCTIKRTDLFRAVSNSTKEQLERCAPEKDVIQFPAWTDIEVFCAAQEQGMNGCSRNVLYAGVLTPLKGVHHLISAFSLVAKEFPAARLMIVGREESPPYARDLRQKVQSLGLDARVVFRGSMPQAELAAYMQASAVLVLPSASEGLPRVVIEAMATGTPVVCSRVGGIPEIVDDGATGFLIEPGDEQALAEKIGWLLANPEKTYAMGERARAFARQFVSTESYIRGYKQIFETVQETLINNELEGDLR